ncbi:MAG: hypothetical protein JJ926_12860 [Roseitalea sp.]|uniref:hypothetical protein n=1 Tax=Oceaniradius stylonematis TaxID=2184161 RepID=UPI000D6BD537|nr:hypothetical protein [Oceaniradius stylonematis]MBO6553725.1 hypothetical protein [Roseitalea sp.]MBO6952768.1 hypothetical protein [Rhizobiaceae bacterium]MBO6592745.1 hypothetical protein [Roseitalea sp.]MBO6600512.1 hypothetical protein [Roseitalea sp.]MBO6612946.1 hypothetical protein [Roseitalea sp.]
MGIGTVRMAGNIISLDRARQDRAATLSHAVSVDEFAIKVACARDPMFWVRVKRPLGGDVHVTDFQRGAQSRAALADGLIAALQAAGIALPRRLRFSDIAPMGASDPRFHGRLAEAIEDVRIAADAVARRHGAALRGLDTRPRGGKVDAEALFAAH